MYFSFLIQGFEKFSNDVAEKKENAKRTKKLMEELKNAKEAKEIAEHNSKLAANTKEAAQSQTANDGKTQIEDQAHAHTTQKPTAEKEVKKQKLTTTGIKI